MTPTPEDLARWKALADAATPGPWDFDLDYEDGHACVLGPDDTHLVTWQPMANCGADAQFMAAARTAVPSLLVEVERLTLQRNACAESRRECIEIIDAVKAERAALRAWEAKAREAMGRVDRRGVALAEDVDALRAVLGEKV